MEIEIALSIFVIVKLTLAWTLSICKRINWCNKMEKDFWFASEKAKYKVMCGVCGVQTTAKSGDSNEVKHL